MKPKLLITIALLFLSSSLLAACGPGQLLGPTLTPVPTDTPTATFTPVPTSTPLPTETPTPSPASAIPLTCDDGISINAAEYQVQNNTWGKGKLTGWSQCIGIETLENGGVMARWTWDWLNSGGNVKAYPEIMFGQKPGGPSTSPALPIKVNQVESATMTYDITSTHTGGGNIAFEAWLTDTDNPDTWGVPPITHEVMIWLDSYGGLGPGGQFVERTTIGGVQYNFFVGYHWGDGWTYIAFDPVEPQMGAKTLEIADFLEYLKTKEIITGEEYLASFELGNEVTRGSGETLLNLCRVTVLPK
jgi:hypothetical protein